MSIKTLRKRIAITATSALIAGVLSVIASPAASAHSAAGSAANTNPTIGQVAGNNGNNTTTTTGSLFMATKSSTAAGGTAAVTAAEACATTTDDAGVSKGLLYKDSSSGIAQSATVLAGGILSFYACTNTAVAFVATGGTFSGGYGNTWQYNSSNTKIWSGDHTEDLSYLGAGTVTQTGTAVATLWTAPTTTGTYTVSYYTGYYTNSSADSVVATASNGGTPATLSGNVTVTVVAKSAGGSYSAGDSYCQAVRGSTSGPSSNVDDSGVNANGVDWSIDLALNDAYGADLDSGALVASATNGALVAWGTAGATPVAGTASTATSTGSGSNSTVRVSQGTAGAPVTTTVTLSYNGTTVCSKTVSIAGQVANLTISSVAVQDLSSSAGNTKWFSDGSTDNGTFYIIATDSAGNRIATPTTIGTFSVDSSTLGTIVTDVTFPYKAATNSTSDYTGASKGSHTCAATAGTQKGVVVKFTLANGTVISSKPTDLSCANDPYTVSASFDKAKYISGEVAKLTVEFKDSKGFAANNAVAPGASTISVPGMTLVSTTGAADAVAGAGGKWTYTYTVGQTAGKYAAVVDFTGALVYSAVQNPAYEISTGGDTTTNADVLKSIVALIASINKQIQALQKLILKR